jgi:hypothetical protein
MSSLQLTIFFVSASTMRVAAAVFMPTVSAESGTQHRKVSTTTFNLFGSWYYTALE